MVPEKVALRGQKQTEGSGTGVVSVAGSWSPCPVEGSLLRTRAGGPLPAGWGLEGSGHSLRDSSLSCPTVLSVSTEPSGWLCC